MAPSRISIVFFLLLSTTILTAAIPPPEYDSFISALRSRNYDFFADAISTTDIHSDILSSPNFTLFVPTNFSSDIANNSISDYINTTRFHIVPNYRLTASDLRKFPYGIDPFPSLVPGQQIHLITYNRAGFPVSFNGVRITVPDLYRDKNVVVHGIKKNGYFSPFPDRTKLRRPVTDVDIKAPAWPSDNSSRILVTPEEARALAKYLVVGHLNWDGESNLQDTPRVD